MRAGGIRTQGTKGDGAGAGAGIHGDGGAGVIVGRCWVRFSLISKIHGKVL